LKKVLAPIFICGTRLVRKFTLWRKVTFYVVTRIPLYPLCLCLCI
jgi:hypothetical protein